MEGHGYGTFIDIQFLMVVYSVLRFYDANSSVCAYIICRSLYKVLSFILM